MGDGVVKRSVAIAGHRTSISLEEPFWEALRDLAARRSVSVQALVGRIDAERGDQNLSSAIRVFVLNSLRECLRASTDRAGAVTAPRPSGGPEEFP